jgi:Pterin 4 alpha carbinolamine dehydratase
LRTSPAEREQHHPDLHLTSYRQVEIVLYTHSIQGITENDLALAKMIESEVLFDYSPKWLKEWQQKQSPSDAAGKGN